MTWRAPNARLMAETAGARDARRIPRRYPEQTYGQAPYRRECYTSVTAVRAAPW